MALAIGAGYVGLAYVLELDPMGLFEYAVATFVAECLIWFPEQAGAITGMGLSQGHRAVDRETPGCAVFGFGWLMLICVPLVYWSLQPVSW